MTGPAPDRPGQIGCGADLTGWHRSERRTLLAGDEDERGRGALRVESQGIGFEHPPDRFGRSGEVRREHHGLAVDGRGTGDSPELGGEGRSYERGVGQAAAELLGDDRHLHR